LMAAMQSSEAASWVPAVPVVALVLPPVVESPVELPPAPVLLVTEATPVAVLLLPSVTLVELPVVELPVVELPVVEPPVVELLADAGVAPVLAVVELLADAVVAPVLAVTVEVAPAVEPFVVVADELVAVAVTDMLPVSEPEVDPA